MGKAEILLSVSGQGSWMSIFNHWMQHLRLRWSLMGLRKWALQRGASVRQAGLFTCDSRPPCSRAQEGEGGTEGMEGNPQLQEHGRLGQFLQRPQRPALQF